MSIIIGIIMPIIANSRFATLSSLLMFSSIVFIKNVNMFLSLLVMANEIAHIDFIAPLFKARDIIKA